VNAKYIDIFIHARPDGMGRARLKLENLAALIKEAINKDSIQNWNDVYEFINHNRPDNVLFIPIVERRNPLYENIILWQV